MIEFSFLQFCFRCLFFDFQFCHCSVADVFLHQRVHTIMPTIRVHIVTRVRWRSMPEWSESITVRLSSGVRVRQAIRIMLQTYARRGTMHGLTTRVMLEYVTHRARSQIIAVDLQGRTWPLCARISSLASTENYRDDRTVHLQLIIVNREAAQTYA